MSIVSRYINKVNLKNQLEHELRNMVPIFVYTNVFGEESAYAKIAEDGSLCFLKPVMHGDDLKLMREFIAWLEKVYFGSVDGE